MGGAFGPTVDNPSINLFNLATQNVLRQNQVVMARDVAVTNIVGGSVNLDSTGVSNNKQVLILCTGGQFGSTVVADSGRTQIGGSVAPRVVNPGTLLFLLWNSMTSSWDVQT